MYWFTSWDEWEVFTCTSFPRTHFGFNLILYSYIIGLAVNYDRIYFTVSICRTAGDTWNPCFKPVFATVNNDSNRTMTCATLPFTYAEDQNKFQGAFRYIFYLETRLATLIIYKINVLESQLLIWSTTDTSWINHLDGYLVYERHIGHVW
jgi:hypothetical protein